MFPDKQQLIKHYREVLAVNDKQQICLNPYYPKDKVPEEIAIHSLSTLQPLLKYKVHPGNVILDIGCGAGADCFLAAYQGGSQVKVHGIDIVEELIDRANTLKAKYKVSNVSFTNCSAPPIQFPGDSFDLVMMNYSFHLFQNKGRLLSEVKRTLNIGGTLVIADSFAPKEYEESDPIANWLYSAGGAISVEEFNKLAAEAGLQIMHFSKVETEDLPEGEVIGYMVCSKMEQ